MRRLEIPRQIISTSLEIAREEKVDGIRIIDMTKTELMVVAAIAVRGWRHEMWKSKHPIFIASREGEVMAFGGN